MNKFVGLIILDGFGINESEYGNAIKLANPINFNRYFTEYPATTIQASGEAVGLPKGLAGNSEVGHLNIGAGRVVYQSLQKINNSIKDGSFFKNEAFLKIVEHVKSNDSTLHLMGLLSEKGAHGNMSHLFALMDLACSQGVKKVKIHCFMDGRDDLRDSGINYLKKLQKQLKKYNNYEIATLVGRAYAMDRDKNYNNTKHAYDGIVFAKGIKISDPIEYVLNSYANGEYDEFLKMAVVDGYNGVENGDGIIFYNFREDRARQLTESLVEKFDKFTTKKLKHVKMCTLTNYNDVFKNAIVAFDDENIEVNLATVLSKNKLKFFKITETTKYAHVTYFLNGGVEKPYKGEDRFMIDTIKDVNYKEIPEMKAEEIANKAIEQIKTQKYSFMALNFSNPDMIGHTGDLNATIKAIKCVDKELGRVVDAILSVGGVAVVIADHGNADEMLTKEGKPITNHTANPVPFILISKPRMNVKLRKHGKLGNVAPTILELLGVEIPKEFILPSMIE